MYNRILIQYVKKCSMGTTPLLQPPPNPQRNKNTFDKPKTFRVNVQIFWLSKESKEVKAWIGHDIQTPNK
jgi:hypothetical protein